MASIIAVVAIVDGMNLYMHDKVFEQGSGLVNLTRIDEMKILTDFDAFLDHILVTSDALAEHGGGETEVLHLDEALLGYTLRVSDHRPVVTTFAIP